MNLKTFQTELSQYPCRQEPKLINKINLTDIVYYKRKVKGKVKKIGRVEKKMDVYSGYYINGIFKPNK